MDFKRYFRKTQDKIKEEKPNQETEIIEEVKPEVIEEVKPEVIEEVDVSIKKIESISDYPIINNDDIFIDAIWGIGLLPLAELATDTL